MRRWIKDTILTPVANFFSSIVASIRSCFVRDQSRAEDGPLLPITRAPHEIGSINGQNKNSQQNSTAITSPPNEILIEINNDEQKKNPQQNSIQFSNISISTDILHKFSHFLSVKDTTRLASANKGLHMFFQALVGSKEAKDAAECAIYPTEENVEKLKTLLKACPALLRHPVEVKNRHNMTIKGTVYQIALHECDNRLIDDVIKEAFNRFEDGEERMEAQRKVWLPDRWMEKEEKACALAFQAIDRVFIAFNNASNPNDVTALKQRPYTITINHQGVKNALETFRKAIDALYKPKNEAITSGRDPSIQLLERVIYRHRENYHALGGAYNGPRNNVLIRMVFGYCQRFAPINFMQAFARRKIYNQQKLTRSFEYCDDDGNFILPLGSGPQGLGYEYFALGGPAYEAGVTCVAFGPATEDFKAFCQSKTEAALESCIMPVWEKCITM